MDDLEQPAEALDSEAAAAAASEHEEAANQDQSDDSASQEQAEEDEEVEIGGRKVAMPKSIAAEIKSGTMRNADYTQKTQALAADRKAFEAEREQQRQSAQQYSKEMAKVQSLGDQIAEFQAITPAQWEQLSDQDPLQAQKLQIRFQGLQQQHAAAVEAVTQKQNEHALNEQRTLATQVQEADAYFKREIPNWSNERSERLQKFAIEQGLNDNQALAKMVIQNPALAKVLHKAELYDQLEKKQGAKQPAKPTPPPAPVTRVGASRATAAKDPNKMGIDDWMANRNKQLRNR